MDITCKIAEIHAGRLITVEPNIEIIPENLKFVEFEKFDVALNEADIHVLLVDHKEFKKIKLHY